MQLAPGDLRTIDIEYEKTVEEQHAGRQLAAQFSPVHEADPSTVGSIRIKLVWDLMDAHDIAGTTAYQCTSAGQQVAQSGSSTLWQCTTDDFVTAVKRESMVAISTAAAEYWADALQVVRTASPIDVSSVWSSLGHSSPPANVPSVYNETDLVVIVTARPTKELVGYARCLAFSQHSRCLVGQFNWVPGHVAEDISDPEQYVDMLHTGLHELAHLFSAITINSGSSQMVDATGARRPVSEWTLERKVQGYDKSAVYVTLPQVVAVAREQFGCDTLDGVPVEDLPLGKAAHWEARVLGSELMAYGTMSGVAYVSDLTLAFLNSTNHYAVQPGRGGPLLQMEPDEPKTSGMDFLKGSSELHEPAPEPKSPGYLMWGRGAGCDFVEQGPAAWPAKYVCTKHQDYGCTPDNRMAAVCMLSHASSVPQLDYTCGERTSNGDSVQCTNHFGAGESSLGLPGEYQYFGTSADDVAPLAGLFDGITLNSGARVGGVSAAMDFVPARVSYWNCQLPKTSGSGNSSASVGADVDSSLFGSVTDMSSFAGQDQCATCRCMSSSLVQLTSGVNPTFPKYGLCYRTNCFREDYLQIAVRGVVSKDTVNWYKCPPTGGKLYIPGYTGALHCPVATEFCAMETITGVRYAETDQLYQFIFWGSIGGTLLLLFILSSVRCIRERFALWSKFKCGIMVFEPNANFLRDSKAWEKLPLTRPNQKIGTILRIVNYVLVIPGLAVAGLAGYGVAMSIITISTAISLFELAAVMLYTGITGLRAARAPSHGMSCSLAFYLLLSIAVFCTTTWLIISMVVFMSPTELVHDKFDTICAALHSQEGGQSYCTEHFAAGSAERTAAEADLVSTVESNMAVVQAAAGLTLAILLSAVVLSVKLANFRVLISFMYTALNYMLGLCGLAALGCVAYIAAAQDGSPDFAVMYGMGVTIGLLLLGTSVLGVRTSLHHRWRGVAVHLTLLCITIVIVAAASYLCIARADDAVAWLQSLPDSQRGNIIQMIGVTGSGDAMAAGLKSALHTLGFGLITLEAVMILCLVNGVLFLRALLGWVTLHPESALAEDKLTTFSQRNTLVQQQPAGPASSQSMPDEY